MSISTMQKQLIAVLLFFLTAIVGGASNPEFSFRHIDGSDGLSANHVKCIIRDRKGFMWFGTTNGLDCYDGMDMRRFDCRDENLNRWNNNIGALYEDGDGRIWVGTDRGVYIYDQSTGNFSFVNLKDNKGNTPYNWVQTIQGDSHGNIYALIPDQGLFKISEDKLTYYNLPGGAKSTYFTNICVDSRERVWAVTDNDGVYQLDADMGMMVPVETAGINLRENVKLSQIIEWDKSKIVLASENGKLYLLEPERDMRVSPISFAQAGSVYLRSIARFDNTLWVGTQTGLYVIDMQSGQSQLLKADVADRFSLSDNAVYYIYRDNENDAWIGTTFGGVNYLPRHRFHINSYSHESSLSSTIVSGLACDGLGKIWIGTENGGMNKLDPVTGTISHGPQQLNGSKIIMLGTSEGDVVVCPYQHGLLRISPTGNLSTLAHWRLAPEDTFVFSYLHDSKGTEWVGTGMQLYKREAGSQTFAEVHDVGHGWFFCLYESSDGVVWIGTMGKGLWRYNPVNGSYHSYTHIEWKSDPGMLRSNSINSIMEDKSGNVWISTDRGGLSCYDKANDCFKTYGMAEGLPDDVVYGVLDDNHGNLWFGTNRGLVKFDPESRRVKLFSQADGLPASGFSYNSAIKHPNGDFYFGTSNGLVWFNPDKYTDTFTQIAPIYFTVLNLPGAGGGDISLTNRDNEPEINLDYNQNTFSVKVASPEFGNLGRKMFSYRLLPSNKDWLSMEKNRISFANLPVGEYELEVRCDSSDNSHVEKLKIIISPPWWQSRIAWCFYTLLVIALVVAIIVYTHRRNERELRRREAIMTDEKEKELYRNKIKVFSEIAHEIRTPLSLINLPLEAIEELCVDNQEAMRYLKITRQNMSRLMQLTNMLLDFQKADTATLKMKPTNFDIVALTDDIADRFEPAITVSGKHLKRNIANGQVGIYADKESITKIISNLLNNALKYADKEIEIELEQKDAEAVVVRVISDGRPVSSAEREKIFEAFYRGENRDKEQPGVGIGLALSRSLAQMNGGTLDLKPSDGFYGNIFQLMLPVAKEVAKQENLSDSEVDAYMLDESGDLTFNRNETSSILLVEDNSSISDLLADYLRSTFRVTTVSNGAAALEALGSDHFDAVVTDIMMSEMDGLELCRRIKADMELCHIPVIFITAKNDLDTKLKGLSMGAEAYIEKPFSAKYLRQVILSLLENRKRERESFSKKPFFGMDRMQLNKADEEFMKKVIDAIHSHISEENFNVEGLAAALCMSRSNLLRKIKPLFNLSPQDLIKLVKLKRAAELIRDGRYRINEICQMVGINSPSYFTKIFVKQFNVAPKEFAKQCQAEARGQSAEKTDSEPSSNGAEQEPSAN